jgi:hypothetical protein
VKRRAETDMPRDEARAGDDGEMEGAAEALHPLIGEKIALETLLDDPCRWGRGDVGCRVTNAGKRGLGGRGRGGGARLCGRPATNPIGSPATPLRLRCRVGAGQVPPWHC